MSEIVVSNSGPLIVFSKLNILHLLEEYYGEIIIPRSVYNETVIDGIRHGYVDAFTLRSFLNQYDWKTQELALNYGRYKIGKLDAHRCRNLLRF